MTVVNNATADGSNIEQRTYNGTTNNQLWIVKNLGNGLVKITNTQSGKVIQIAGASTANGAALQIGTYNTLANQHFSLSATDNGYFRITPSQNSGKPLT
ncbi:RICIN domain-containing protein [Pedobacter borealis]|uniref:RICIN domain-containing protein n=1 Tax=Pedobacter borealis TaxID=475254 RepID=UPI0004930455|nr:RICIN domain-containing protein [Pedobacter borealis]